MKTVLAWLAMLITLPLIDDSNSDSASSASDSLGESSASSTTADDSSASANLVGSSSNTGTNSDSSGSLELSSESSSTNDATTTVPTDPTSGTTQPRRGQPGGAPAGDLGDIPPPQ